MANIRTSDDQIRSLKATLPKGTPDNVIIIQNGRQPHLYMCTSCHSWRCGCNVPSTTQKYTTNKSYRDPLHLESTVYEKGFIVPNKVKRAWTYESIPEYIKRDDRINLSLSKKKEHNGEYGLQNGINKSRLDNKLRTKKKTTIVLDLSQSPLTARRPFRVSSAHWASRTHTQQWPWKGQLQCKLVSGSGENYNGFSKHTRCWTYTKSTKK